MRRCRRLRDQNLGKHAVYVVLRAALDHTANSYTCIPRVAVVSGHIYPGHRLDLVFALLRLPAFGVKAVSS